MSRYPLYDKAKEYEMIGDMENAYFYYLESAISEDYAEAFYEIGQMYYYGDYVEKNMPRSSRFHKLAYEKGSDSLGLGDLLMIGTCYQYDVPPVMEEGFDRDMEQAVFWYERMAEKGNETGDLLAYVKLGHVYMEEEIQDCKKAYRYFKKSNFLTPEAQFYTGLLYLNGGYVKQNFDTAKRFFKKAMKNAGLKNDLYYERAQKALEWMNENIVYE